MKFGSSCAPYSTCRYKNGASIKMGHSADLFVEQTGQEKRNWNETLTRMQMPCENEGKERESIKFTRRSDSNMNAGDQWTIQWFYRPVHSIGAWTRVCVNEIISFNDSNWPIVPASSRRPQTSVLFTCMKSHLIGTIIRLLVLVSFNEGCRPAWNRILCTCDPLPLIHSLRLRAFCVSFYIADMNNITRMNNHYIL